MSSPRDKKHTAVLFTFRTDIETGPRPAAATLTRHDVSRASGRRGLLSNRFSPRAAKKIFFFALDAHLEPTDGAGPRSGALVCRLVAVRSRDERRLRAHVRETAPGTWISADDPTRTHACRPRRKVVERFRPAQLSTSAARGARPSSLQTTAT